MIAIFDYGAGNLQSVQNTLAEIGATYTLTRDSDGLRAGSKIILPGVGHFGQMMRALDAAARPRNAARTDRAPACRSSASASACRRCSHGSEEAADARGPGPLRRHGAPLPARCARAAHGLEPTGAAPPSQAAGESGAASLRLLRAQLLRARRTRATAATCTYTLPYTAVLEDRQRLRRAVPSREIRADRAADRRNFRGALMLAKRIIPCLDVTGGRVVKGVNFVNLRDAGDPVELADRYNQQGADEAGVSRHHRLQRRARHHGRRGGTHGAQGFHPAGGGRRHPLGRRCAAHPDVRRGQGLGEHGGGAASGAAHRAEPGIRRAGGGAGDRRAPPRARRMERLHARRPRRRGHRRGGVGRARRATGRGRDSAHLHGYRRRAGGLRLRR